MPSSTLSYSDRPNLIRQEGQTINAKFDRIAPTIGRISWNIPMPAAGCNSDTRAYNGVVVVGGTRPADASTSPVNGQYYQADRSLDSTLHAGDKIGHGFVVAAHYGDVTTTFVDVTDLDPNTPYYFSVYAVDNVLNYYRAGAHTYSATLTGGRPPETGQPAHHAVYLPTASLQNPDTRATGLNPAQNYSFYIEVDCKETLVTVTGASSQTFSDLMTSINAELDKIGSPYLAYQAPNTGAFYYHDGVLQQWAGNGYDDIELFLPQLYQGTSTPDGTYWIDTLNNSLFKHAGGWNYTPFITFTADPATPECGMFLFNGTTVFKWDGNGWCATQTFVQTTNPFVPSIDECQTYWYDSIKYNLNKRANKHWTSTAAIYSDVDPNALPDGFHWYDTTTKKLKVRNATSWSPEASYFGTTEPTTVVGGMYWYDASTQVLQFRNLLNTAWEVSPSITYATDPAKRMACDAWWEADTDVLREWDSLNAAWVTVKNFIISDYDPAAGVVVQLNATWYNPSNGELRTWEGLCDTVSVLHWLNGDPRNMGNGTVWYNPLTKKYYERSGTTWNEITNLISFGGPPTAIPIGTFWFDGVKLNQWNGAQFNEVMFSTTPLHPNVNAKWFNLTTNKLNNWDGSKWVETGGTATAVIYTHDDKLCWTCPTNAPYKSWTRSGIYFYTEGVGSSQCLRLRDVGLFSAIGGSVSAADAYEGSDGVNPLPTYMQDGVGTSGSEDERKLLTRDIELSLGGSGVTLEIGREDIDHSIDRAIRMLRLRAAPYTRAYFPVGVTQPMKKRYLLTNKKLGHDKIVRVIGVYRGNGMWPALTAGGVSSYTNPAMFGMMGGKPGGDMATHHLQAAYIDEMETILARRVSFFFNERSRVLEIHNNVAFRETLLVEASTEMTEQDIMLDRRYRSWVERWAVAESQMKLAEIRGKFQTIPGPGGGTVMNAAELRASSEAAMTALITEIDNFIVVDLTEFPGAFFAIG